jgi:adenylate cyclase
MSASPVRKLAAIVVADVVRYSRMMEADEVGTLARLKSLRSEILDPVMRARGGRLVKLMGDGLLAEFASAVAATEWALEVQKAIAARNDAVAEADRMMLRVGVNVGEVLVEDDDLYGDGVNVAARLEPLAPPGGICISAAVHEHVQSRIEDTFASRGERTVKNIAKPIAVFAWSPYAMDDGDTVPFVPRTRGRKPTVAIGTFEALGGGPDAASVAAAVREAATASLANLTGITVLATTTGADYLATASMQFAGNRYRTVVRLADLRSGEQFWSDRFEGTFADVFEAEDEMAPRVSQALRFAIYDRDVAETESIPASERTSEMILARIGQMTAGRNRHEWPEAGPRLDSILIADPGNASARTMKACWHLYEALYGWRELTDEDRSAALMQGRLAVRANDLMDYAHVVFAMALLYCDCDQDGCLREAERARDLSPYSSIARWAQGLAWVFGGRAIDGYEICVATLAKGPRVIHSYRTMQTAAVGAFVLGRYGDAVDWAKRSDHHNHDVAPTLLVLAASAAAAGLGDEASGAASRLLGLFPDLNLRELRRWPFVDSRDADRFVSALADAGVPR